MSAYYNENDPRAAEWLRELIRDGLIAGGEVDERSIEDVSPTELLGFTQCHFFAGIGGWSKALRLAAWPDDKPVWTGSCPCQPFSAAGKRKGTTDERHLWPAWHWLISQCKPHAIFGEQVASKDGIAWLDIVSTDLENENYAVAPVVLPACGVGAFHIRQRLWFVAQSNGGNAKTKRVQRSGKHGLQSKDGLACELAESGREQSGRRVLGPGQGDQETKSWSSSEPRGPSGAIELADDTRDGRVKRRTKSGRRSIDGRGPLESLALPDRAIIKGLGPESDGKQGRLANASELGDTGSAGAGRDAGAILEKERETSVRSECDGTESPGSTLDMADANGERCEGFGLLVQPGEQRECDAETPGPGETFWSDVVWVPCRDGKSRPVKPGIQPLADGVRYALGKRRSARIALLRGAGNAIVPQVAAEVIKIAMEVLK